MIRGHVVSAILWRNLKQYFSGVLGYVIIVAFVTVCAVMTFSQQFFSDNLANLDQLSSWFPLLLLFLAPAITMTTWADERRQGTDAILFTLPASDLEITLGKFLAAASIYTIALLFSASQLISLSMLGTPDWGVVAANYLGYWLAGLALLSIGMFASSLTDSPTVAFVLGAVLCSIPVLIGSYFRGAIWLERLGLEWHLQDFNAGLVTVSSVLYFLSLIVLMLYLNLVVIGYRLWQRGAGPAMSGHFLVRVLSLGLALVALNYIASVWAVGPLAQADLTAERLFTLDAATHKTLNRAREEGRSVNLKAFISREVPREYVNVRKSLLGLLRQFDSRGKNMVNVQITEVDPDTEQEIAALAEGIEPAMTRSDVGGRIVEQKVFLGAVVTTPKGDVKLPQINRDTSLEYELTRGIASAAADNERLRLGILATDLHFGGPEVEGRRAPWAFGETLRELEKMYSVQHISQSDLSRYVAMPSAATEPGAAAPSAGTKPELPPPDVLLVADPSSLDSAASQLLVQYLAAGNPGILLCDPLPFFWTAQNPEYIGVLNNPLMPRVSFQSPYANLLTSSFAPKADGGTASSLMKALGLRWNAGELAWSLVNPHPNFPGAWPPFLGPTWPAGYGPFDAAFVYARSGAGDEMFLDHPAAKGLSEVLFFYPGAVQASPDANDLEFLPMVSLGKRSGAINWSDIATTQVEEQATQNPRTGAIEVSKRPMRSQLTNEDLLLLDPGVSMGLDNEVRHVAAQVRGKGSRLENVIVICDTDFVSNLYYDQQRELDQPLDNLRLLQNSVEVLTGDPEFVALRNRRPRPRTLSAIEKEVAAFREARAEEQKKFDDETTAEIAKIQAELDKASEQISEDQSLNFIQKIQQASQSSMDAQSRFDRRQADIEKKQKAKFAELKARERKQTQELENRWRSIAILLAPLPALLLGLGVFFVRWTNENREVRRAPTAAG